MRFPRILLVMAALSALAILAACGGGSSNSSSGGGGGGGGTGPTGTHYTTCNNSAGQPQWVPDWQSTQFQTNYQAAVKALIDHVSTATYASQIGYIRIGLGRGGEILLPTGWNQPSSGACYGGYTTTWNYSIGGTTASDSSWNSYLTGMLNYEGGLNSPIKLMVGLAPMTMNDDPTDDYLAGVAFNNGIAFGNQGLQTKDMTTPPSSSDPSGSCGGDWCNLFTNLYPTSNPRELQTLGPSCPSGSGCSGTQSETGPLPALISYGLANGANDFEIYASDWEVAFSPTSPSAAFASTYQPSLTGASTSGASLQVLFPDPTDTNIQNYVLTQPIASGVVIDVDWSDIQPQSGSFDFATIMDANINNWLSKGAKQVNLVFQDTTYGGGGSCPSSGLGSNGDSTSGNCAMPSWMWTVLQ